MPTRDDRITCAVCAWRGTCAKKFSKSGELTIHCIDFTRDVAFKAVEDEEEVFEDYLAEQDEKADEGLDER